MTARSITRRLGTKRDAEADLRANLFVERVRMNELYITTAL